MTDSVSLPEKTKPPVPGWVFKRINPFMKALLRSRLHSLLSNMLMLITYKGSKSGKLYTNPIGYVVWDKDELMSFTSARWWTNVRDGKPVKLLLRGKSVEAVPTVITERAAMINALEELVKRVGIDTARKLPIGLPKDREPTRADLEASPTGITLVHFKITSPHSKL